MSEPQPAFRFGPARLAAVWDSLRESFWVLPGVMAFGAVVLGLAITVFDDVIDVEQRDSLQWLVTTAGTARATLSALAGSMMTVAGVVFSLTMVTLSLTASQFGSRLLRTFLNNNLTQFTIGAFLGTSLYCMVVLRTIRDTENVHDVPHTAVAVAVGLAVFSFVVFVYFVHHVIASIQAQNVVRSVFLELRESVDRLFPDELKPGDEADEAADERLAAHHTESADGEFFELIAHDEGYLQAIEFQQMVRTAACEDVHVNLLIRPGQFVSCGVPIASITTPERPTDEVAALIRACFVIGSRRTPRQDIECAIDELAEVAIRALSPGINDPVTAVACVDYLGAALGRMAGRQNPRRCRFDDDGNLRVTTVSVTLRDALNAAFDQIRQYSRDSTSVTIRMLEALSAIARHVQRDADRRAVLRQADMIIRGSTRTLPEENDRDDVRRRFEEVQELLAPDSPDSPASTETT